MGLLQRLDKLFNVDEAFNFFFRQDQHQSIE